MRQFRRIAEDAETNGPTRRNLSGVIPNPEVYFFRLFELVPVRHPEDDRGHGSAG